jgi:hypothetical protein
MYKFLDVPSFNAKQDWLHNVCDVVNFFFSLIGLGHIVWNRSLLFIGWRILQIKHQWQRKITNI